MCKTQAAYDTAYDGGYPETREAESYSPVTSATTRLKEALAALETNLDLLKQKLEPVMIPSQPATQKDQVARPDYPGGSPVVRDLSFFAEQVGDMIQMIDGISGRLEV